MRGKRELHNSPVCYTCHLQRKDWKHDFRTCAEHQKLKRGENPLMVEKAKENSGREVKALGEQVLQMEVSLVPTLEKLCTKLFGKKCHNMEKFQTKGRLMGKNFFYPLTSFR